MKSEIKNKRMEEVLVVELLILTLKELFGINSYLGILLEL